MSIAENPRCGIFDLDGVIVDTAKYHYLAWRRLAQELFGFDFSEQDNELLKGVSRMRSLEILLRVAGREGSEEQKTQWASLKNTWYVDYITRMDASEILPGAREYLQQLRARGGRTALGSASQNAGIILDRLGIAALFDTIVDGNAVSRPKPDPEVFLLGAKRLEMRPADCVVFEDAQAGIDAARSAGMKVVGIGKPSVLRNADLVVPSLQKLVSV